MASRRAIALVWMVAVLAVPAVARESDSGIVLEQISALRVDGQSAVRIHGLKLNAGLADLYLDDGVGFPAGEVAGRVVEIVFLGEGRIRLRPSDDIEAGQLRLFTGGSMLDETFGEAVLVVPLDAASKLILSGRDEVEPTEEQLERASEIHREWKYGKVRESLDVEGTLWMDALGDPMAGGFFAAWFRTEDLGDFFYLLQPDQPEQVTVGQFVPWEMSEYDADRVARLIRDEQRRGGLIGVVRSDLGMWDTWLMAPLRGTGGGPAPGNEGFEPTHYTLEVELADESLELEGRARIDLRSTMAGRRFVPLRLGGRWSVREVRDRNGLLLDHRHSEGRLLVGLGRAVEAGEDIVLDVLYEGQPFVSVEKNTRVLSDPLEWFPRAGQVDRATYDVTFRWPGDLRLVASGTHVDGGADRDGRRWERRREDIPVIGFSFELGNLHIDTVEAGHVRVELAFHTQTNVDDDARKEVGVTVRDVLAYYEELFGPYPLDHLTVVFVPRDYSQGLLGFVTLAEGSMQKLGIFGALAGNADRRLIVAHELAHQWWGNLVGWGSYRDQWLSEAVAEYAAQRYATHRVDWEDDRIPSGPTTGWYEHLSSLTPSGLEVEAIGPMVLGWRLDSSHGLAYRDIVYRKGAVTLEMLVRYLGEDRFNRVLASVVKAASNRIVSTDAFFALAEKVAGADLGWFVEHYVRGTGIPEVLYDYEFVDQGDGSWAVEGEARQVQSLRHEYVLIRTEDGALDVRRMPVEEVTSSWPRVVAPLQVLVHDPGRAGGAEPNGTRSRKDSPRALEDVGNAVMTGRIVIEGPSTPIRIELPHEPRMFWLDRNREVFARFHNAQQNPKRAHYREGLAHQSAGRLDAAEQAYLRALDSELRAGTGYFELEPRVVEQEARRLDTEVRLLLARLYTDRGEYARARQEIALARKAHGYSSYAFNNTLAVFECRLDLLEGDAQRAFARLRKIDVGLSHLSTEGYLLFAIAAKRVDKPKALDRALRILRVRDADVSLLVD